MVKKSTSIFAVVALALLLIGTLSLCTGCSSQESSSQNPAQTSSEAQQPSEGQPPEGGEPPEGMEPPEGGERPEGMPGNMGFNMTDEEFEALLEEAIAEGTITEEDAAEITEWWQQRPEFDTEEIDEAQMEEMSEWMQSQPESARALFGGGMGGPGGGGPPEGGMPPEQGE